MADFDDVFGVNAKRVTPPEGLRDAADLLDAWARGEGDEKLVLAFADICAVHDSVLECIARKSGYALVLQERAKQLAKEAALGLTLTREVSNNG
jgi:hypothetical protein